MRIHMIVLGVLLAAGCTAQDSSTATDTPPAADSPATAPTPVTPPQPEPTPEPPTANTVPEQFQGDYAAGIAACTSPGHVTELTIGASRIEFHESTGDITAVDSSGNDIDITAQLTGEGETRGATYSFSLSDDQQTLTDTVNGLTRQRCD
ncbi:MAG: hypothetical protein ACREPV_07490 [Lysobacter sp.]